MTSRISPRLRDQAATICAAFAGGHEDERYHHEAADWLGFPWQASNDTDARAASSGRTGRRKHDRPATRGGAAVTL